MKRCIAIISCLLLATLLGGLLTIEVSPTQIVAIGNPAFASPTRDGLIIGSSHYVPGSEIVEKRTGNSKTFWLGGNTYRVDSSLGPIHYKDALSQWQDIDIAAVQTDTGNFTAQFTRLPYTLRIGNDGYRRIYPDRNDLSYWIDIGKPFPNMGTPVKSVGKWTWDFPNATLIVAFGRGAVKFEAVLKNSSAPSTMTIPFSTQGMTRQGNDLIHNGVVVAQLRKPFATDAHGVNRDVDVTFNAGSITLSLDTAGLAYPITIDPSVDVSVGASADDCWVRYLTSTSAWVLMAVTNTLQPVGRYDAEYMKMGGGMRFLGVNLPAGATISSVNMTMVCATSRTGTTVNSVIVGELSGTPAAFSNIANYQARRGTVCGGADDTQHTVASQAWNSIPAHTAGTSYTTPDFTAVLQEMVDTVGALTDVVFFWDDHAGAGTQLTTVERDMASWDNVSYDPPAIHITYTSGTAPTVVSNSSTNINATSANVSGNITATGGENADSWGFQYDTDSGAPYTDNVTFTGSQGEGEFSANLTGLDPGTLYYWRAFAHNSAGYGYGSEDTFLTRPNNPSGLTLVQSNNTSIEISWTNGTGTDYAEVRYDTGAYPADNVSGTLGYWGVASTCNLTGLDSGQIYYIRIWNHANDGALWSTSSGTADGTKYTRPGDAVALTASVITDTSFDLTWIKGTGGDKTHVRYLEGDYPLDPGDGLQAYFGVGVTTTVTPLLPNREYYTRAWAYDSDSGYYSENYTQAIVTTLVGVPTVTNGVGASNIANDGARLNGEITYAGGENPTVTVFWGTSDGGTTPTSWSDNASLGAKPLGTFYYDASGLLPGTLYYYTMRAVNGAGTAWATPSANFTTTTLLLAPTNFTVADLGAITLNASWVMGVGATYTHIRVKRNSYPASITDGEFFYYDNAVTANGTGYNIDVNTFFFRAWSFAADNVTHSVDYADASIGGDGMSDIAAAITGFATLITGSFSAAMQFVPLVFMGVMAFWRPHAVVMMTAGGISALLGLNWRHMYPNTPMGLTISVALLILWVLFWGFAFTLIFKRGEVKE